MKNRISLIIYIVIVLSFLINANTVLSEEYSRADTSYAFLFPQSEETLYEPNVVLVKLSEDICVNSIAAFLGNNGYVASYSSGFGRCVRAEFKSMVEAAEAANILLKQGLIESAQPNYGYSLSIDNQNIYESIGDDNILHAQSSGVNDPMYFEQWGLESARISEAWDLARGEHKVTVAALDLGFDVTHEDLKANIVDPYNATNSFVDVSPVVGVTENWQHGTHVAGVIAGVANNGVGIAGVSYNANIMPVKVVRDSGTAYTWDLLNAYDYVISKKESRNVRVVNFSMGHPRKVYEDDMLITKIREAYDLGIVTVCAAGNSSSNAGRVPYTVYPGDYPCIVSVIDLDKSGNSETRSEYSNYNFENERTKDIAAPGTDILSTVPNNSYSVMSGTSMAAPLVSGILALEFAANPYLTATAAVERLYASTTKLTNNDFDIEYGWGKVNAYQAVRAAIDGADPVRLESVRESMAAEGIPRQAFIDVFASTAHYEDIYWLFDAGISNGWDTSRGKEFRPYSNIGRADMASFLFRLAKKWGIVDDTWQATEMEKGTFCDVSDGTPHAREIWWLASTGISEGWLTKNGKEFRPYAAVARADMAAFIYRLASRVGISAPNDVNALVDVNTNTPHCKEICWLVNAGISLGWNTANVQEFRPYNKTARADMAAFLHRLDNLR